MVEIQVMKRDIEPLVYFIVSMFQQENYHRQGTSSKSDYIGGYIDRWINKIPENLLFNNLLLEDKEFGVVNDYFVYGSQSDKNAPDVLGLKANGQILKFAEFNDNTWNLIEGKPYIEVKTFKQNQKLVTVRETQLNDDYYYVFVSSDFKSDYLISFFEESFFNNNNAKAIEMDDCFIRSNENGLLSQAQTLNPSDESVIGTISLISIIKGSDFRSRTCRCNPQEGIYYVKDIIEKDGVRGPNTDSDFCEIFEYDSENNSYGKEWNGKQLIPIISSNSDNIKVVKINKKSFYIETNGECSIYDTELEVGKTYQILVEEFQRSSRWTEYVGLKNQYIGVEDRKSELIEVLEALYNEYLVS